MKVELEWDDNGNAIYGPFSATVYRMLGVQTLRAVVAFDGGTVFEFEAKSEKDAKGLAANYIQDRIAAIQALGRAEE